MLQNKKESKQNIIIIILILIILLCVSVIGFLIFKKELKPDYAPGVIDVNAVPLPDEGEKLQTSEGGGAVSLSFSDKVNIDLENKEIQLYFKNPSKSTQDMVIQIIINDGNNDMVIAQSDRIPVGYAIYKMNLLDTIKLQPGGYNGKFNIMYFDSETQEKAVVNTNIPITIATK